MTGRGQGIEGLTKFIHLIPPPLRTLPIGTVHIGITHGHIQGTGSPFPQLRIEGIVARERTGKLGLITCLPVLHLQHLHAIGQNVDHLMTIHPAQTLVTLNTCFGDIFGTYTLGTASYVIIGPHLDAFAGRSLYLEIGCYVRIIG